MRAVVLYAAAIFIVFGILFHQGEVQLQSHTMTRTSKRVQAEMIQTIFVL